jgi:predicted amidohydrolase
MDDDQLKNGCSMIVDPFGDIIAECRTLCDDVVTSTFDKAQLTNGGGYRYKKARKPELYADIIGKPHEAEQKVAWLNAVGNQAFD